MQNKKIEVAVYMPDSEASKWLLFQQYYEPVSILIDSNVFEQKNCEVLLNFDKDGVLQTVNRRDSLYSRRHSEHTQSSY